MTDNPFSTANKFADNPEPRCPVVLLLDRSGSMAGESINQLNQGLGAFFEEIKKDALAALRVEVALITFGGQVKAFDLNGATPTEIKAADANGSTIFTGAYQLTTPPILTTDGQTPMGAAVELGLRIIRECKEFYKQNGITYYRPWMFLITDGEPTDSKIWELAAEHSKQEEGRKGVLFYGVGTDGANFENLARFSNTPPLRLKGLAFRELFQWLSNSLSTVALTDPANTATQVALPPIGAWGQVNTTSN